MLWWYGCCIRVLRLTNIARRLLHLRDGEGVREILGKVVGAFCMAKRML